MNFEMGSCWWCEKELDYDSYNSCGLDHTYRLRDLLQWTTKSVFGPLRQ